ncbi:lysophospholipid acyltransferase LPEAT2-like isoform X2 [Manihot esculenta]|uniref:lysophospholipid acyltransferase LPEAT2-like isoform X2 n=1 Tax=Manihot esculenta TaxID=3983 RepID=UPI001CC7F261|nr:lysophospholipid acyltransferase LPEAT2-like isoform X2 [Manihot esculenta]
MADHDLSSPLLPPQPSDSPHLVLIVRDSDSGQRSSTAQSHNHHHHNNDIGSFNKNHSSHLNHIYPNPFEFLGSDGLSVPPPSTVDPFRNSTPNIEGAYEVLKLLLCLPIVVARLVLFGACLAVGFIATKLALEGWKDKHNPMPIWRSRLMWVTRMCARCILFSFGYQWIRRKGEPAPREIAPIVVSNHVSYIDPIFYFYELFPTIVAAESHDSIPFVGTIIRAMQVIYVDRFSHSSRKQAVNEIKRKASCDRFPRVLLFPEGTTTNGKVIISFQLGAFIPGQAIQPVVVRYPYVHFDQSWGDISLAKLLFRMFTQFHNFMEVEYLPIVSPLDNCKENPAHFAKRLFHISSLEAVDFLDKFLSMNPDPSGRVKFHDFLRAMRLKTCKLSEEIFGFIDVEKNGSITFKQFLYGSAHVMKQPFFRQSCELAFTNCSDGGDGQISKEQFGDIIRLSIPDLDNDEMHELFKLFGAEEDGRVNKDSFMSCLRKNPLLIALFSPCLVRKGSSEAGDMMLQEIV